MKKEVNTQYKPIIRYENESVDIALNCSKYLLANNYKNLSVTDSINLLEENLISYSLNKLWNWNRELLKELSIDELTNLDIINKYIADCIPDEEAKRSYFIQYIHCIIYIIGVLNNQNKEIIWHEIESLDDNVVIKEKNNMIIEIATNKSIPINQLPSELINNIKAYYKTGPVLKK